MQGAGIIPLLTLSLLYCPASLAIAAGRQRRKDALVAEWQSQCEALKQRREAALAAKTAAESDYANARTQQQAERAERAIKESVAALKVRHGALARHGTCSLGKGAHWV